MLKRISVLYQCGCKASGTAVPIVCPKHYERWVEQWESLHEIHQLEGSKSCGQACVAMVLGTSLDEAIELFGHDGATYAREIAAIVRLSGLPCPPKMKRTKGEKLPRRGILWARWYDKDGKMIKRRGHWMVAWDGKIHDPGPGGRFKKMSAAGGAKVTAYLEIEA